MYNEEMEYMSESDIRKRIVGTVLVTGIVIALIGYGIFSLFTRNSGTAKMEDSKSILKPSNGNLNDVLEQEKMVIAEKGELELQLVQPRTSYNVGETVQVNVVGSSDNQPITGYDVVLRFDSTKLRLQDNINQLADMQFVPTSQDIDESTTEVIVTGIKRIDATGAIVFDKTNLVELTFVTRAPGSAYIDIIFQPGSKQDSNLMNDVTQDVLGAVKGVQLQIR